MYVNPAYNMIYVHTLCYQNIMIGTEMCRDDNDEDDTVVIMHC